MKKLIVVLVAAAVIVGGLYLLIGNPVVFYNNQKMNSAMLHEESNTVTFNNMTNFEWDAVYYFDNTVNKKKIQEILGFDSSAVKNPGGDTFIQIVFVKDDKVVCNLNGAYRTLGYKLVFSDDSAEYHKVLNSDNKEFTRQDIEGVICYIEVDKGIVVPPDKQMGIY